MASQPDRTRGQTTCVVDVSPDVIDAGAELTLHVSVSCAPPCDLRGHTVSIRHATGADAASGELTGFDGQTNETSDFAVRAPSLPGTYTWLAVFPALVKDDTSYPEASAPFSFTVKLHTVGVVAWDIPPAIVAGERFRMKVGVKCSSECRLANTTFAIYDHDGSPVATATLSDACWPGTTGLHFAEVELEAPAQEGLHTWTIKTAATPLEAGAGEGPDAELPHAEGSVTFGITVVSAPECLVRVETVDKENQTPLSGARVVMHPYRAVTDERGIAEVRVARGAYKLFVSQTRYITVGLPVEVTADMTARAELYLEPLTERN